MLWETDKKAVSSFYDRGYIAERLKGLETELALECRITLNGEERWSPQCGHTWRNRGFRICHDLSARYHRGKGRERTASADGSG